MGVFPPAFLPIEYLAVDHRHVVVVRSLLLGLAPLPSRGHLIGERVVAAGSGSVRAAAQSLLKVSVKALAGSHDRRRLLWASPKF